MRFRTQVENISPKLDMTPFVDVVFQLIIFFMLTTPFIKSTNALAVALPKAMSSGGDVVSDAVVTVTADNQIWMGEDRVQKPELASKLSDVVRKSRLTINGDRRARLGAVVDVWDAARLAGFAEVNVATQPQKEERVP